MRIWPWTKFDQLQAEVIGLRAEVKWVENERDHYKRVCAASLLSQAKG